MIMFYIVMSVLWGLLMFLNSFKNYKWYICIMFVLSGILFWPFFVLVEVITTAIKEFRTSPAANVEISPEQKRQALIDVIRENLKDNE